MTYNSNGSSITGFHNDINTQAEPKTDALATFTVEWQAIIDAKIAQEFEEEKKVKDDAATVLTAWKKQREIRIAAKAAINRSAQSVFIEQIESDLSGGNDWERVCKLVDITQDPLSDEKEDVSKMKSLLVQLKTNPIVSQTDSPDE